MELESIISLGTTAVNLITIICYTITICVKQKKNATNTLNQIVKTIPAYISQAKATLSNATNKTILNFVLAEIKDDFEELINKKSETVIKNKIEEVINGETKNTQKD